jgi:hypothetical protein
MENRADFKELCDRVILKYIGDHYLFGKVAEQDTTDV